MEAERPARALARGVGDEGVAGELRIPFPMRSVTRTASTCHGSVAIATKGRTVLARPYPKSTSGLRFSTRSAITPEASFSRLDTVSAAPSTRADGGGGGARGV